MLDQREAVLAAMDNIVDQRGFDVLLLLVTNLLEGDSTAIVAGEYTATVAEALDTPFTDRTAFLPGFMSRKKQVVPPLEDAFK